MRKHAVLLTLAALEALAVALLALFWFVMRPELLASYGLDPRRADGRSKQTLPALTQVAFSGLVHLAGGDRGGAGGDCLLAASANATRTFLAGTGLVWTVFGLAFAIWSAYAPVFEQMGN